MEMNLNINFSATDLEKLVEDTKKIKEDEKERKMKKFTEIIQGVARKYASKWVDQEDLEQDLWVRVLTLIEDCGGIENTDEELVASICFNKAVDKYRYHRRRYDSKAEYLEGSSQEIDTYNKGQADYSEKVNPDRFMRGIDLVFYKEVIDLFPIGSKERKYAVMKVVNYGLLDKKLLDPWDQAIADIPETDDEEGFIHLLGYKSHCPGSWTVKKRAMKELVYEFLRS